MPVPGNLTTRAPMFERIKVVGLVNMNRTIHILKELLIIFEVSLFVYSAYSFCRMEKSFADII
jgi:hypothetical protein